VIAKLRRLKNNYPLPGWCLSLDRHGWWQLRILGMTYAAGFGPASAAHGALGAAR